MEEPVPEEGSDAEITRTSRRRVLEGIGAVAGASALGGVAGAKEETPGEGADGPNYSLSQGDACVPLVPLSGDTPVEELYDYRVPERYVSGTNGASDPGSGPYYASVGTRDLQRPDTSLLFLYDGPEGLSLVIVHDVVNKNSDGGGSATFEFAGVPSSASWVVKDDFYRDPDTGDIADTNYDRWKVDGSDHRIDWTWGEGGTDGGVLRGLGEEFRLGITPAFNEKAALAGEHYEGTVSDWQALTATSEGIQRVALSLDNPIVVGSGACAEPLFDVEVGSVSVVVRRDGIAVRVDGSTVEVSADGVDVDLNDASGAGSGGGADAGAASGGEAGAGESAGSDDGVDVDVTEIFGDGE